MRENSRTNDMKNSVTRGFSRKIEGGEKCRLNILNSVAGRWG